MEEQYYQKYLKYKEKYINLKKNNGYMLGGARYDFFSCMPPRVSKVCCQY